MVTVIESIRLKKPLLKDSFYLLIPYGLAFSLRWVGIGNSSIWYDEGLTIYLTREPLIRMIQLLTAELNPPLWEILEWVITRLITASVSNYRLLSLVSSLGILIIAQKILAHFQVDRIRQFLSLSMIALSPYQIWMAQDARVYALMSFLYLLGFWFLIQQKWLGLLACCGLLLYSNSAAVFYVATLLVIGLLFHSQNKAHLLGVGLGAAVSYSPWLIGSFANNLSGDYISGYNIPPVTAQRLIEQFNLIFLIGLTSNPLMRDLLKLMTTSIVLSFLLITLLAFFFGMRHKPFKQAQFGIISLLILSIMPLALITLTGWVYQNGHIVLYRSFSPLAVAIILLIAMYSKMQTKLSTVPLLLLLAISIGYHTIWSPQEKGGHLKEIVQGLSIPDEADTVIFHITATSLLPFELYLSNANHYLLDANLPAGFLNKPLQVSFGLKKVSPQEIPSDSYWLVWAKDAHLPPFISEMANDIINENQPVARIEYPQAATIYIYHVSQTTPSTKNP